MAPWLSIALPVTVSIIGFAAIFGALRQHSETMAEELRLLRQNQGKMWDAQGELRETGVENRTRIEAHKELIEGLEKDVRVHDREISKLSTWREGLQHGK